MDAGIYDEPYAIWVDKKGAPDKITTIKAKAGTRPHVQARDAYGVFRVNGSYVTIEGLEVSAPHATGNDCGGLNAEKGSHHVTFRNNIVHDTPGGGIGGAGCDYVTIENNTVYNCCKLSGYQTSGISIYEPKAFDNAPGFHFIIRRNRSYDNEVTVPDGGGHITDGNGIILDDFRHTQDKGTPFTMSSLVENNLCYRNGGRGVHLFYTDNVTVRNNTTYQNQKTAKLLGAGELSVFAGNGNTFVNNIAVSRTGGVTLFAQDADATTVFDHDVFFNGKTYSDFFRGQFPPALLAVNPQFKAPDKDDFRLLPNSAARNAGNNANASKVDYAGQKRPRENVVDIGAFEF